MKRRGQAEIIGAVFFVLIAFIALFSIYEVESGFVSTMNAENELIQQQQIASSEKLVQVQTGTSIYFQSNVSSISTTPSLPSPQVPSPQVYTHTYTGRRHFTYSYTVSQPNSFVVIAVSSGWYNLSSLSYPSGITQQFYTTGNDSYEISSIGVGYQSAGTYTISGKGFVESYVSIAVFVFPPGSYSYLTNSTWVSSSSISLSLPSGYQEYIWAGASGNGQYSQSGSKVVSNYYSEITTSENSSSASGSGAPDLVLGGIAINYNVKGPFIYRLDGTGLTLNEVINLSLNISVPFLTSQNYVELKGVSVNNNQTYLYVYAMSNTGKYYLVYSYIIPSYSAFDINVPITAAYILNHQVRLLLNTSVPALAPSTAPTYHFTFYKIVNIGSLSLANVNVTTYYPNDSSYYLLGTLNNKSAYTFTFNNVLPSSSNLSLVVDVYNTNKEADKVTISGYGGSFTGVIAPNNDTRYTIPISSISSESPSITVSGNETTGVKEVILQALTPNVIAENTGPYPAQIIRIWSLSNPPIYQNVNIIVQPGQSVNLSRYFTYGSNEIEVVTSNGNIFTFYD